MKINEALKRIRKTGEMTFGEKETLKSIEQGDSRVVIITENTPREIKDEVEEKAKKKKVPVKVFQGTSLELGELCRRPHVISTLSIESKDISAQEIEGKND